MMQIVLQFALHFYISPVFLPDCHLPPSLNLFKKTFRNEDRRPFLLSSAVPVSIHPWSAVQSERFGFRQEPKQPEQIRLHPNIPDDGKRLQQGQSPGRKVRILRPKLNSRSLF